MQPPPSYAVLFKTHFWDDFVESQFRQLQSRAGTAEVFILVDETHGPIEGITHGKVIRMTEEISQAEGLFRFPKGNTFWYNTDYQLHHFTSKFPEFEYIVTCEYDVTVRTDLLPIIQAMAAQGLDFVGEPIRTPKQHWHWKKTAIPYYGALDFTGRLCCFAIFSRSFSMLLLLARKDHLRRLRAGELPFSETEGTTWPSNEAIIGAEIARLNLAEKPISAFADASDYDWWPPHHPDHVAKTDHPAIFHPVLPDERFVKSLFKHPKLLKPESWLEPNSTLRARLDQAPPSLAIPALLAALIAEKNINAIIHLWLELKSIGAQDQLFPLDQILSGLIELAEPANLALGKPCTQSSVCPWSRSQIPQKDAANAVNGRIAADYAFHTDNEFNPWWMVDLGSLSLVSEVILFNRPPPHAQRANNLSVWSSTNGREWTLLHRHSSPIPFGGADGNPLKLTFAGSIPAQFIRIELSGIGMLHLAQVQVFGTELKPKHKDVSTIRPAKSKSNAGDLQPDSRKLDVFVLNLDKDTERLASIQAAFEDVECINLVRVSAVNGKDLPELARELVSANKNWAKERGQIGCFLSHIKVWEIIASHQTKFSVVLEDDAQIINFERVKNLMLPEDADLVFINDRMTLAERTDDRNLPVECLPFSISLKKMNDMRSGAGTDGYILTPLGARKLLNAVRRDYCCGHIDGRLVRYSVNQHDLDSFSETWVQTVVRNHHNPDLPPLWNVIKSYSLNTPLVHFGNFQSSIADVNRQ